LHDPKTVYHAPSYQGSSCLNATATFNLCYNQSTSCFQWSAFFLQQQKLSSLFHRAVLSESSPVDIAMTTLIDHFSCVWLCLQPAIGRLQTLPGVDSTCQILRERSEVCSRGADVGCSVARLFLGPTERCWHQWSWWCGVWRWHCCSQHFTTARPACIVASKSLAAASTRLVALSAEALHWSTLMGGPLSKVASHLGKTRDRVQGTLFVLSDSGAAIGSWSGSLLRLVVDGEHRA
jgi:hypothetical protein